MTFVTLHSQGRAFEHEQNLQENDRNIYTSGTQELLFAYEIVSHRLLCLNFLVPRR